MFQQMLHASYWFTFNPALVDGVSGMILFSFFALLLVFGIVMKFVASSRTTDRYLLEVIAKTTTLLITMGFFGVFLYFFSFERIRFFGSRFWYPLWVIATALWTVQIVRFYQREIPVRRQQSVEQKAKQKYFPPRHK